jgi:HD superfamily phosphohydrolase
VTSRFKLFNDPVHGFVAVPKGLLLSLVETPEFQRLRRIRQLGLGFLVFPGAVHTRFEHGLGAMALMHDVLTTLGEKGTLVATDELEGALAAALLHDVGHGPFSHTLEHELLPTGPSGAAPHHEHLSRALMARLNDRLGGALDVALAIFDGSYPRPFFHGLLASQLDMDRLDYLRRDAFYTGVAEGGVGVQRVVKTMRVHPTSGGSGSRVVIEAKGSYAVENVLLSRRMYWQVYLHKTVLAADHVLRGAFARARSRWGTDAALDETAPPFAFFVAQRATADDLARPDVLDAFTALDDADVLYSLKRWAGARDRVLADLARRMVNRDLFRTVFLEQEPDTETLGQWRADAARWLVAEGLSAPAEAADDAALYVTTGVAHLSTYRATRDAICILERDGRVRELSDTADGGFAAAAAKPYVCFPKSLALPLDAS